MINNRPLFCFVENLTLISWLFYIIPFMVGERSNIRHNKFQVYYFDSSKLGNILAQMVSRIFGGVVEEFKFRLVDVKDKDGNLIRLRLAYYDLGQVQSEILKDPIFETLRRKASGCGRLYSFISKRMVSTDIYSGETIWRALFLIRAAYWRLQKEREMADAVLFINRREWFENINDYAAKSGIRLIKMHSFAFKPRRILLRLLGSNFNYLRSFKLYFSRNRRNISGKDFPADRIKAIEQASPKLCVEYYGHLNLDRPELNSDLFFLNRSKLEGNDILLSFDHKHDPLDERKMTESSKYGISCIALSDQAVGFSGAPAFFYKPVLNNYIKPDIPRKHREYKWLKEQLIYYKSLLDFWHSFFENYGVRIYVSWYKYSAEHCAIAEAIQKLGGILAIYQRAYEEFPSAETAISADVVFCFSRDVAEAESISKSRVPYYVVTGYFGDYRFSYVNPVALAIKQRLQHNGAKHIIAYFDENSADDSRWHTGHEFMRENYLFLLEKALKNPKLGIVFKPKVPSTLRRRLGPVAELLKQAEETGRCFVFEGGAMHGSYPPTAAALAADVAIHGHLCAATAGVESALAGVPTLLIDREGWQVSKLYRLGKGRVVFKEWAEAWEKLGTYFNDPKALPGFGNWSPIIGEIDPFRDGRAAERIGDYLSWLLEGFKTNIAREELLASVAERYRDKWGRDKIIEIKKG